MQPASPARHSRRRSRRGSTMLEFAFMLPFFLLFLSFSVNVGALVLQHGALQTAANSAAIAGAQVGGGNVGNTSKTAFYTTVDAMPGIARKDVTSFTVRTGKTCAISGTNRNVTVDVKYNAPLVLPGMGTFARMAGGASTRSATSWPLKVSSLSRCEVVR
jgi:Flp pilus assembly protein TadG